MAIRVHRIRQLANAAEILVYLDQDDAAGWVEKTLRELASEAVVWRAVDDDVPRLIMFLVHRGKASDLYDYLSTNPEFDLEHCSKPP